MEKIKPIKKHRRKICGMCKREVAMKNINNNKEAFPHKCPHGTWCRRGKFQADGNANEPGCSECRARERKEIEDRNNPEIKLNN